MPSPEAMAVGGGCVGVRDHVPPLAQGSTVHSAMRPSLQQQHNLSVAEQQGMGAVLSQKAPGLDTLGSPNSCGKSQAVPRKLIRMRPRPNEPGRCGAKRRRAELFDEIKEAQAPILALPPDLLIQVFHNLSQTTQRALLPLVCRQWQELLSRPSTLWNHLELNFLTEQAIVHMTRAEHASSSGEGAELALLYPSHSKVSMQAVLSWLAPRAASVKSLRMRGSARDLDEDFERAMDDVALERLGRALSGLALVDRRNSELDRVRHGMRLRAPHNFTEDGMPSLFRLVHNNLQELVLEQCSDLYMGRRFFPSLAYLTNLKVLSLKNMRSTISDADFKALASLTQLQEVVLDCDQPPDTLEDPSANEIKWGLLHFPEAMMQLTNMTHLTLSCHYGITQLPTSISRLNKLQVLNLDFCTLANLPPSLGKLTALTTLDVEGNVYLGDSYRQPAPADEEEEEAAAQAEAFPEELCGLQGLQYLNLNSCGLTSVPLVISTLQNLQTLDLEGNELGNTESLDCGLSSSISKLSHLQCLNLAACRLAQVPGPVAEHLGALRILDLTNNRLTNEGLPPTLTQLKYLKAIGLKRNCLTSVPRMLGAMTSLQEIYLEDNAKLQVEESLGFLEHLVNLETLMMGKQVGSWSAQSMHFVLCLALALKARHPNREILTLSYPGQPAPAASCNRVRLLRP